MDSRRDDNGLIGEMLGSAGLQFPDLPVLLGDSTAEQALDMGVRIEPAPGPERWTDARDLRGHHGLRCARGPGPQGLAIAADGFPEGRSPADGLKTCL